MKMTTRTVDPRPTEHVFPAISRLDSWNVSHFEMATSIRLILSASAIVGDINQCVR